MEIKSITAKIAEFVSELRFDAIPPEVIRQVKWHLLDAIGCALAATDSELMQQVHGYCQAEYATGHVPLLGMPGRLGMVGAAFYNSAAINALDYDDGFEIDGRGMGHPGASLVAAALSGLGAQPVTGQQLLTALVAAYEVNGRLIQSIQPTIERFRQVYGVCQHQSLGSAIALAKVQQQDSRSLVNILGLAGTLAPLPSLRKYNWEQRPLVSFKDFNAPATEAGVKAVVLHRQGLVGAVDILDGPHGFWRMMGSDQSDPAILEWQLGHTWLASHASLKPYPACRWLHTVLESFEHLLLQHQLRPEDIDSISVYSGEVLARDFMDTRPANMVDAQFSLPHTLSCLAHRVAKPHWHHPATRQDQSILALASRVDVVIDPELNQSMREQRRPAGQVYVRSHGRELAGPRLDYPFGCHERPFDEQDCVDKFLSLASTRLPGNQALALAESLLSLEHSHDVLHSLEPLW